MSIDALEANCGSTDGVVQSADDKINSARRTWSKPTLDEVDIVSITMSAAPTDFVDGGFLS
ncbi:hypothetical protein [Blastomonas sp. AAP53]|uniref:hypothetical protein n=1 Tax=Blastomonas sp. AAP53 TaxID=1248760 RepID=UPI0012673CE6|nr:hypothetical protein [Blastomonas sp. AAP53]